MTQQSQMQVCREQEIVDACLSVMVQSNWEVGRLACEWKRDTGLSDAELGERIGLSKQQVQQRRSVWERFADNSNCQLSWTHYCVAVAWDDADEVLRIALEDNLTVDDMKRYRRAKNGELEPVNLDASDVPESQPAPITKPQDKTCERERGQSRRVPVPESRNTTAAPRDSRKSAESGKADAAAVSGNSSVGKPAQGAPSADSVEPPNTFAEIQRLLDRFDAEAKDRKKQAKLWLDRAVKLDPTLKPKVPTVAELIEALPVDLPEDVKEAAILWVEHKQSLIGKDRIRSMAAWQTAIKQMRKYPPAIVAEAITTATTNGWTGWLQESVKREIAFAGGKHVGPPSRTQSRSAENDAAFEEVFGAEIGEEDVPY